MRRRIGFLLIFGSALSLAVASIAWACGNLTTLNLNTSSAAPGAVVTGEGDNYSNSAGVSNVEVHLGSRDGPVLWSGAPVARTVSPTFTIPAGTAPGYYTLVATQYQSNGLPVGGAPGRARIQVTGGAADPALADAAAPSDSAPASAAPAAVGAPAAAAGAPSSRATTAKKKAKKARRAKKKKSKAAVVAAWSSSTPPSAPGPSEASSAGAGSLSASAALPGILVALVMLPTGLLLVRSRGGQDVGAA